MIDHLIGFGVGFVIGTAVVRIWIWVHRLPPIPTSFDQQQEEIYQLERMYYGEEHEGEGDEE